MKRFHSNLQKVCDLCRQQSRLAELAYARARAAQSAAENAVEIAFAEQTVKREQVRRALQHSRQATAILGMQQHLEMAADHILLAQKELDVAREQTELARKKYQEIHSQVERLERLIERQRMDFRREMFHAQQTVIDDVAMSRWSGAESVLPSSATSSDREVSRHG